MFDTKKSYTVRIKRGGQDFVHTLKQPEEKHIVLFERKKDESLTIRNSEISQEHHGYRAQAYLWELLVESVDGYGDLGDKWREKVPVMDRIRAAQVFGNFKVLIPDDVEAEFGREALAESPTMMPIYLSARQGNERMLLTHLFRSPDMKQFEEFARIKALSKTRRKRNRVEILFPVTTAAYCRLYEDLCAEVAGYKKVDPAGVPTMHKLTAIQEFMAEVTGELEEVEGN